MAETLFQILAKMFRQPNLIPAFTAVNYIQNFGFQYFDSKVYVICFCKIS